MNEYDLRQIDIMRKKISDFESSKITLHNLIFDLRALLDYLQTVDEVWKRKFYNHWFELEQTYAIALDRKEPLKKYDKNIKGSLSAIKDLIEALTPR